MEEHCDADAWQKHSRCDHVEVVLLQEQHIQFHLHHARHRSVKDVRVWKKNVILLSGNRFQTPFGTKEKIASFGTRQTLDSLSTKPNLQRKLKWNIT